jgi:hypothetical protein
MEKNHARFGKEYLPRLKCSLLPQVYVDECQ